MIGLTTDQRLLVSPVLERARHKHTAPPAGRVTDVDALDGVLWKLRTGASWHDMPSRFPSYSTCRRRYLLWRDNGTLRTVLQLLAEDLEYHTADAGHDSPEPVWAASMRQLLAASEVRTLTQPSHEAKPHPE